MQHYRLNNVDQWKAWFALNRIPSAQIVRGQVMAVDTEVSEIEVVEFLIDSTGARTMHECACEINSGHLAKVYQRYPFTDAPGLWAEADRVK